VGVLGVPLRVAKTGAARAVRAAGLVVDQARRGGGQHRDDALAGVGLGHLAADAHTLGGQVDVVAEPSAQLRHARADQRQGLDRCAARDVVAVGPSPASRSTCGGGWTSRISVSETCSSRARATAEAVDERM